MPCVYKGKKGEAFVSFVIAKWQQNAGQIQGEEKKLVYGCWFQYSTPITSAPRNSMSATFSRNFQWICFREKTIISMYNKQEIPKVFWKCRLKNKNKIAFTVLPYAHQSYESERIVSWVSGAVWQIFRKESPVNNAALFRYHCQWPILLSLKAIITPITKNIREKKLAWELDVP